MNAIGGYFELDLIKGAEFHPNAIALNTGRNALELILKVKKYKKVFIPYYTCDVILEPLKKTNTPYEFYSINKNFEPVFDYSTLKPDESFLYTNYFGLKEKFINELVTKCKNLILDNSQSFFSLPQKNVPTFYSCRKFFGVPDGAYLYLDNFNQNDFPIDYSSSRITHLIKRIEYDAEAGYNDFKNNDNSLIGQPIKLLSKLTKALLCNIDYKQVQKTRKENFLFLHKKLSKHNTLEIDITTPFVPMVYPFFAKGNDLLRSHLISLKIYTATYWSNVFDWVKKDTIEFDLTQNLIHLPIDQRYSKKDLKLLLNIIDSFKSFKN